MDQQPRLIAEERDEYTVALPNLKRAACLKRPREKLHASEFRSILLLPGELLWASPLYPVDLDVAPLEAGLPALRFLRLALSGL